ncbi:MAG: glycosyltransferase family 9 protein [Planctomycetes bacterium]|nr:glycosyltransferase family 9 protein [Planctomycetota bacterium]
MGLPLCGLAFLLGLPARVLRRLFRRPDDATPAADVRRVLVIKFLGLGSVLLATPMLERLRRRHPGVHVTFLTFAGQAPLVGRLPNVDEVLVVPRTDPVRLFAAVPGLLWRLRRARFDVVIDLEFYSRLSNLVSWGSGARRRIGFFVRARWRGSLLTDPVYFNPTRPYGEAVLALLRPLGLFDEREPGPAAPLVPPLVSSAEHEDAWTRLVTLGVPSRGTIVVVNPNASDLCVERRWPAERFGALVKRFAREVAHVDRFVFIGAPADAPAVAEVLRSVDPSMLPRCLDLSGRTTLVELMVLLTRASLLISNDSGPMHLAAALSLPTISFFGPETPALYGPVGARHLVFYAGHWCSPCLSVYNAKIAMCNGENECMRRIGLDDVISRSRSFCLGVLGLAPPVPAPVADHMPSTWPPTEEPRP